MTVYGYCRISTNKQSIERQVRNIRQVHSEAIILKEVYTGTKFQGRKDELFIIDIIREGMRQNDSRL